MHYRNRLRICLPTNKWTASFGGTMNKKRRVRVRFREIGKGRDGGLGNVKSFLSSSKNARKKLRKNAIIVSIRDVK